MALPDLINRTPTTIRVVSINMTSLLTRSDPPDGPYDAEVKGANYTLEVLDQFGEPLPSVGGDLIPHITIDQRDWLIQFMDDLRVLAEAKLPS